MAARILIIEDNAANLELMTYLLRAYKYEPISAMDGAAGLALAQQELPDVIVCDLQMPKLDGFEVLKRLKAEPRTRAIPVVAVTAFAMVGDRERVVAAGFDGYLSKPIEPETFVSQIERFLKEKSGSRPGQVETSAAAAPASPAGATGARILVVDNTQANRELIEILLQPSGFDVAQASNVSAALAIARKRTPDLIISDIHMPGEDGFDLLQQVRSDPALRDVPFIFTSATSWDMTEQRKAMQLGADLFMLTPTEPEPLLREIEKLLSHARGRSGDDPGR
ncbi:MAG TPA: response regulator [Burkholderiales bacterium]|nr:response regulator [Burkholderiales bacterium]